MDGQSNDVYEQMERSKQASQLPGGMAVLYASAPIFSPTSKDPEGAEEVYQILPEEEAVQQGVNSRRLVLKIICTQRFLSNQLANIFSYELILPEFEIQNAHLLSPIWIPNRLNLFSTHFGLIETILHIRRLLEDALIEMGFPLVTYYSCKSNTIRI